MKKFYIIPFILIFVFCFSACISNSSKVPSVVTTPLPSQNTPFPTKNNSSKRATSASISAIKAIIENKRKYYCSVYKRNIYLKDFHSSSFMNDYKTNSYFTDEENNTNHVYSRFCLLDMDNDGTPEILLESLTTNGNILVFHYENGKVYGNVFSFRGMLNVKIDGSFQCSGGAGNETVGKISFSKGKVIFQELCYFDDNTCRINGKNVSAKEVDKYLNEHYKQKDAEWYTYNKTNLDKYLVFK